jgi:hypothetical protein
MNHPTFFLSRSNIKSKHTSFVALGLNANLGSPKGPEGEAIAFLSELEEL